MRGRIAPYARNLLKETCTLAFIECEKEEQLEILTDHIKECIIAYEASLLSELRELRFKLKRAKDDIEDVIVPANMKLNRLIKELEC